MNKEVDENEEHLVEESDDLINKLEDHDPLAEVNPEVK